MTRKRQDTFQSATRPGEATPQKQEMLALLDVELEIRKAGSSRGFWNKEIEQLRDFIARADLPGEGLAFKCKGRISTPDGPGDCNWPVCGCDPYAEKVIDALSENQGFLDRIAADARRGGPEPDWKQKIIILLDLIRRQGWGPTTEYNGEYFYEDIFPLLDVENFAEISVKAAEYRANRIPKPADIK